MTEILAETYQGRTISVWQITEILQEPRSPSRCRLILVIDGRDCTIDIQRAPQKRGAPSGKRPFPEPVFPQVGLIREARDLVEEAKHWIDGKNKDYPQI